MIEATRSSHFNELLTDAVIKQQSHKDGLALTTVPSIMPRGDDLGVFEEGEKFIGLTRNDNAIACVTVAAAPYIEPTLSRTEIVEKASEYSSREPSIVEINTSAHLLPPHLIVWWKQNRTP